MHRRSFLRVLAAPAIVRAASLMPVRLVQWEQPQPWEFTMNGVHILFDDPQVQALVEARVREATRILTETVKRDLYG